MRAIDLWVEHPDSFSIAAKLNREGAELCIHERAPCYLRCGVHKDSSTGLWTPIPKEERRRWYSVVIEKG